MGKQTAEEIKVKIGSVFGNKNQEMRVKGRDLVKGLPKEVLINENQIREAIMPLLRTVVEGIHETIEATPPELVADIYERGIILSGGGAQLRGFDKLLQKRINIPIIVTDDSATAVIRGTGLILEDFNNLKQVFIPSARD